MGYVIIVILVLGIVANLSLFGSSPDFNSTLLFNVECAGTENELFQCPHGDVKNFSCVSNASVYCSSELKSIILCIG